MMSPTALKQMAAAMDALAEPRLNSRFCFPPVIEVTTPNNEPYGTLEWRYQRQEYIFIPAQPDR